MAEFPLQLVNLCKTFGATTAVRQLDLALRPTEFLSLLGPSGCGKSTTLAMIAGFVEPDEGEIIVNGRVVNEMPPHKRRIGLVFQDYAVFSRLTVRENLAFGLEAQRVPRAERAARVDRMAKRLDLVSLIEERAGRLNMSEMQRVALARVLVTNPQLLLLDEPMSNLDASVRGSLRSELKRIQKELNQSVLYVTHDQVEAMSMSDRIAVMRDGKLLQLGSPDEIYHRPVNRFVAEFIGDPPINILPCTVKSRGGEIMVRTSLHGPLTIGRVSIADGEHLMGIRPHDLRLVEKPSSDSAATTVRFVEKLGAEDVAYVQYGDHLAAVVTERGQVSPDQTVHLEVDAHGMKLIDKASELCVRPDSEAMAA
jgi:multiple sugar transport system ATP-binding protein